MSSVEVTTATCNQGLTGHLSVAFGGFMYFIWGFVLGTIMDLAFLKTYKKIDPKENNNLYLTVMILVQLYVLVFVISLTFNSKNESSIYFLRIGLLSSQLFLLEFALEKLTNIVYNRKTNKSSLVNMPIIGAFFATGS